MVAPISWLARAGSRPAPQRTPEHKAGACCRSQRERSLLGDTIVVLTTHQYGCPVWSAR